MITDGNQKSVISANVAQTRTLGSRLTPGAAAPILADIPLSDMKEHLMKIEGMMMKENRT